MQLTVLYTTRMAVCTSYVHPAAVHTLQFALAIHDNDDDDRNRDKNRDANDKSNVHHHLRIEPFVCKTRIKQIIR